MKTTYYPINALLSQAYYGLGLLIVTHTGKQTSNIEVDDFDMLKHIDKNVSTRNWYPYKTVAWGENL